MIKFVHHIPPASKKYLGRNKHHLIPKSRRGVKGRKNKLLMRLERHFYWHVLFGLKTLDEVIELLIRVRRAKRNQSKKKGRNSKDVSGICEIFLS